MTRFAPAFAAVSLLFAVAACGGGGSGSSNLTEAQASQAFDSMSTALSDVSDEASAELDGASGTVSVTASCAGGGSASADGDFVTGQSFSLDVTFTKCVQGSVTIDGNLGYDAEGDSTHVTLNISGRLTFSGAVTGSCDVDATLSVTSSSATVQGSVCGIEINQTANPPTRR
jgi:hypothetical protein